MFLMATDCSIKRCIKWKFSKPWPFSKRVNIFEEKETRAGQRKRENKPKEVTLTGPGSRPSRPVTVSRGSHAIRDSINYFSGSSGRASRLFPSFLTSSFFYRLLSFSIRGHHHVIVLQLEPRTRNAAKIT